MKTEKIRVCLNEGLNELEDAIDYEIDQINVRILKSYHYDISRLIIKTESWNLTAIKNNLNNIIDDLKGNSLTTLLDVVLSDFQYCSKLIQQTLNDRKGLSLDNQEDIGNG
ncbi:hypothetical protein LCGC14_0452350 [marine sediment metagenome]|uniref:Uncharacterized protein n=1 Tax=marine sediment metagenome TaxID=412755 RepID=A0A0F9SMZ9_9ZZZZ